MMMVMLMVMMICASDWLPVPCACDCLPVPCACDWLLVPCACDWLPVPVTGHVLRHRNPEVLGRAVRVLCWDNYFLHFFDFSQICKFDTWGSRFLQKLNSHDFFMAFCRLLSKS